MNEEYLTVAEVAEICRASNQWVRARIKDDTLPVVKINRKWLIPSAAVRQMLEVGA